jgi:hypothetical protein
MDLDEWMSESRSDSFHQIFTYDDILGVVD